MCSYARETYGFRPAFVLEFCNLLSLSQLALLTSHPQPARSSRHRLGNGVPFLLRVALALKWGEHLGSTLGMHL